MRKGIFPLLFLLLLPSCGKEETTMPIFAYPALFEVAGETIPAAYDCGLVLPTMIEKKMTFPLFVYLRGCGGCETFEYAIDSWIAEKNILLPYAAYSDFVKATGRSDSQSAIYFFEEGKITETFSLDTSEANIQDFLDTRFEYLDILCLNAAVADHIPSAYYANYDILPSVLLPEEESGKTPFSLAALQEGGDKVLYLNDEKIADYSLFFTSLDELYITAIATIDDDLSSLDEETFLSLYGFERKEAVSGFTYVDYASGEILSTNDLSEILEAIDLI